LWGIVVVVVLLASAIGYFTTDVVARLGAAIFVVPLIAVIALVAAGLLLNARRAGLAFVATGLAILVVVFSLFMGLYPRVMVSSLNPDWSLTIYNASSSPYTLSVMSIIALIMVPIVLLYQAWSYWIFRKRLVRESPLEY
jgi:cytochrome d ubiquinol oxidase subunit II